MSDDDTIVTTTSSSSTRRTIYVSSRKSHLAMVQTREVIRMLQKFCPEVDFVVGQKDTIGDQVELLLSVRQPVATTGPSSERLGYEHGRGLVHQELGGGSSFAVHCLKDMPTTLPAGLVLGAICKRESPEDAAIIHPKHKQNGILHLADLPEGSTIGTSSLRREALLRSLFPTFEIKTIRGNIQTRLAKLDEHDDYDAIIVAACGFRRGGLGDRIDELLPLDTFGYGVGQGSIGIECRGEDNEILEMLSKIEHEKSAQVCTAERSLLYHLEGGCQIAMGVNTTLDQDMLTLTSTVLSRDGKKQIRDSITGPRDEAEGLGEALAKRFLENEEARVLLGKIGEKRALTYGDVEAPGDAAAAVAAQAAPPGFPQV